MRLGWISLLALWPAVAVGISGKGYLEDRYQYRTNDQPGQPESLGHRWEGRLEGRWWKDNWSLDGMVLGRFRSQYRDVGGRVENELEQDLKFHELYGTWMSPDWQVRLGRQQVAWGRGDYFRLVDVINPLDLREFLLPYLDDYALGRQPRDMAIIDYYGHTLEHQLVLVPDERATRLAPAGSDFALAGMPGQPVPLDVSDTVDVGWRGRTFYQGTDLDFYAFSGLSPDRLFHTTEQGEVRSTLKRRLLFGASFARPWGDWVMRGDLVYLPKEPVQTATGHEYVAETAALVGLDWMKFEWTANLQATVSYRDDLPAGAGKDTTWEASAAITKDWVRQRTDVELLWLVNGQDETSHLVKATLGYKPWPDWRTELGYIAFIGEDSSFYGQFDKQDRVFLGLRWNFSY